ncbi:group II intron maturase-specific domain-containing protein [Pseudoalteromonas holothuriae]|uniref:group II intron maturase-specific domain-containing protein n=1 Tax=Pseudoalteromonas holothuriae TaxID=2963714 RepID=UPI003965CE43
MITLWFCDLNLLTQNIERSPFRRRPCKNRKCNSLFVSFTPAESKVALKSIRLKFRRLRARMATELSISQLAKWLNSIIHGWIGYYGRYCRSALDGMYSHVNKALVRWARQV